MKYLALLISALSVLAELAGLAALALGVWLFDPRVGLLVAGVELVALGFSLDALLNPKRGPEQ